MTVLNTPTSISFAATSSPGASWTTFSSNFASFASRAAASVQSAVETAEAQVLGSGGGVVQQHKGGLGGVKGMQGMATNTTVASGGTAIPLSSAATPMSYQERQKLLHQQYHTNNATPAYPTPSVSSNQSSPTTSAPSSNNSSPSKANTTTVTIPSTEETTQSKTFLDHLTSNLDTPTKTKLIASALGPLLPGERVIMFLNSLKDVKDSRFPMIMVGSSDVMGTGLRDLLGNYNEMGEGDSGGGGVVTVWCCVMTFYRVAVFSYRATSDGRVLLDDEGEPKENVTATSKIVDNEALIQQWIQSQNISIQFQAAHHSQDQTQQQPKSLKHHVFQMPLASIERVEKVLSSSQRSLAGNTQTSSLTSSSNYPGILPTSSTVSSASSAMSQLGSQMKPFLGSMTSTTSNSNLLTNTASTNIANYATAGGGGPLGIILHGKDGGRWIKFSTNSYSDAMRTQEALNTYAFPGRRNLGYLFAFESRRAEVMSSGAQQQEEESQAITAPVPPTRRRFVPLEEFERQGIFTARGDASSPWAPVLTANASYGLCASYPSLLIGPRSIVGDETPSNNATTTLPDTGIGLLRRCAAFRSENRLPTLTWGSANHGGSIWRSSQPKVGLQGNRSAEDERYLYAIGDEAKRANLAADALAEGGVGGGTGAAGKPPMEFLRMLCGRNNESDLILEGASSSCMLKIMDMRPKSAAMANRTQGYGYENTNYYRGTTINFYGIGNIHAVRDAYQKICALCISPNTSDIQWMQLVENTNWPSMTRLILSASWQTAYHVHINRLPILLHCSHGWDRTSQVSALAQLLLDPYYRTREGFSTLVEKDFLSFGHPFHTRCGHGEGKNEQGGDEGQLSPIFLQFLDCVFQLVNQFPEYFEFNARYLLLLSGHIYSCRFGTLLCDSEREREVVAGIRQRTYCLWEYLDSIPELLNPLFDKAYSEAGVLLMPLPMLLRNVTLWTDRLCMYGSKAIIPCSPPRLSSSQYTVKSGDEQPVELHTAKDVSARALKRAMDDVEIWRVTAIAALKEVEELKKSG